MHLMETTSVELLAWIPKSVLFGAVIALLYACWWIVRYVVKNTHKEVMDSIKEIKHLVHDLSTLMSTMVTLDQHKETKHEIKEYIFEVKDKFESEIKSIKRRIELIEGR